MKETEKIFVTRPFLPPLEEVIPYMQRIWESRVLTNGGPFHQELERELCRELGVPYISLFTNATIALVTALQALNIRGDVITTPFSFVATAHALRWNGLRPVFVDIDPQSFNLDPAQIERALTPNTTAILPVHCYGTPCDVDAIEEIAAKHNLRVIYDAAHAFGVKCHCGSVLNHGDLSVLSFHATKVFNTFEGGAIVSRTAEMKRHIDHLKNFGFSDEVTVEEVGINGKMSELTAAIGLAQLKHVNEAIVARGQVEKVYRAELERVPGIRMAPVSIQSSRNHAYFPILVEDNFPCTRDQLYERLKTENIFARRYFYPLISTFPMYKDLGSADPSNLPVAEWVARRVICLPIYPELAEEVVHRIIAIIADASAG